MSFFRITDPKKRDEMVKDYMSTMKRLHKREMNERLGELSYQLEQERHFKPLIESHEKVVKQIAKKADEAEAIIPKKEEMGDEIGSLAADVKRRILAKDPDVDTTFGIYYSPSGDAYIGNKPVTIQGDDILIENEVYHGTEGLWRLITGVKERQIGVIGRDFTDEDLLEYTKLVRQTSVLHRDFNPNNPRPRSSSSWKWKTILRPLWDKYKQEDSEEEEGSGVKYLPSTIKALKEKLAVLLGEYQAGNTTTRNELVPVLDQLRSRKAISESEYRAINSAL